MTQLTIPNRKINNISDSDRIRRHGPTEISEKIFRQYTSEDAPDYNKSYVIFDAWTDESNPDELRRLALRDILQQTYSFNFGPSYTGYAAYYLVGANFNRILIDNAGGIDSLRKLLRTRPKLLNELLEEFLYVVEMEMVMNRLIPKHKRASYDDIILILLSVTDEATGRKLEQYLSAKYDGWHSDQLFAITTEAASMPQWLRDKNLGEVASFLQGSLQKLHTDPNLTHTTNLTDKSYSLKRLSEFLEFDTRQKAHFPYQAPKTTDVINLLQLIEQNIPCKGYYLPSNIVIHVLPTMTDQEIARKAAVRHIMSFHIAGPGSYTSNTLRTPAGLLFLYWLYGQVSYFDSTNYDALSAIHNLLDDIHNNPTEETD